MKTFKYKFTKLTISLIFIGIALCFVVLGINIYSIVTSDIKSAANLVYPIIQYALMFLVPIVLLVVLLSLVFSSRYSIDGKFLKTSFGIIKSKYDIQEIQGIVLDRESNKLVINFKNSSLKNNFLIIVVKEDCYEDFIDTLCKANTQIEYTIHSIDNDTNKDNKKA